MGLFSRDEMEMYEQREHERIQKELTEFRTAVKNYIREMCQPRLEYCKWCGKDSAAAREPYDCRCHLSPLRSYEDDDPLTKLAELVGYKSEQYDPVYTPEQVPDWLIYPEYEEYLEEMRKR